MKFQQEATISGKNVIAGGNPKPHQIAAGAVTGLDVGHVVLILPTGLDGRWDGTLPTDAVSGAALPHRLAIVTRKQFDGDSSVSILAKGDYVRESCVLADDSALTAEAQFYLTLSDLWAEGEW
ncbi:hypothetical protein C1S99_08225 [Vibrio parahaemolyticus]|uniref:hypothetical protein n=1 Tax=Vibrio parahaemolyticus TaxID=670 RepID=UPI0003A39B12|nr:hypothetical protein [Vibrio parahaemolyticus]EHK0750575.1 hypothetical protein [Vibrio parahaemolyticus]EJE4178491.1 hypothetical protein [Vibrio parahaemolyticus]EKH9212811.1 hypothetical protein [Vibrio parahaemolyticus]EKQ5898142.1 hypothetical protein [Vibrio parahaemolyticus]ELZ7199840.1 hypothetical protein [Vibrio parahaemolyticus]